mmetsp:Transcript_34502/g.62561  ORF Transcript_34502/g.62561 Transcript_34502/m.62561 type:complete len:240 (-) Transcript_34502:54-773(-)|eukprot:CAMPEP_0197660686 /NCGR_PEP_ID=MMETSP1338-20131121/51003_1 /TAXON_ID=43686 ORGANISM="Pelagodinium beii, Strain RCC1491" /NCGR_SAMPLE_ID=MMETSP1338 /ASSEMBLY_ACC=CAM_ASM_000754 /LENGTH=239 /DNA_ID=CAMNT_0043238095 /DNA_START=50 /DNA_END=769 /DNA_ORIENTATION=+
MAYGLRSINNNAVATGGGDFIIFGDRAYNNGKASDLIPQGGRTGIEVIRARKAKRDEQRAWELASQSSSTSSLTAKSLRGLPSIAIMKKWQRVNSQPVVNDSLGLKAVKPPEAYATPTAIKTAASARSTGSESKFAASELKSEADLAASLFRLPTFPVEKYHTFSEAGVRYAQVPAPSAGDKTPPKERVPDLSDKAPPKYLWYADPTIALSNTFTEDHPTHGLAQSKRSFKYIPNPLID